MSTRDQYRQKLYEAERAAFRWQPRVNRTIEDCAARINEIARTSNAWRTACTTYQLGRDITVDPSHGKTSWADSGRWRIQVSNWHLGCDWVLIHELAHLPTKDAFPAHGREFCSLYLRMIREQYGAKAHETLMREMLERGVPFYRTGQFVEQLRKSFKRLARSEGASSIWIVTTSGREVYCYADDKPKLVDDVIYLGGEWHMAATPDSLNLDEVAYLTWKPKGKE